MNTFERTKKHNTKGDRTSLFWRSKKSEKHDGEKVVAMAQSMEGIPEHEKEAMFEKMLDEMNLSEEKKAPLRRRSKEYKEKMLLGFTTAITMPPIGLKKLKDHKMEQPEDYIFDLSAPNPSLDRLTQIIRSLRVALTSNPLTWVHAFGPTGLERILSILDSYNKNDSEHNRIQKECLRCLQKFMNNTVGFKQVLNQDRALSIIAECLNPAKKGVMLEAVKILAPLCLVPEGHSKVLEAITITAEKSQRQRFLLIVEGISKGYEGSGYGSLTLGCLQLINAIISKAHDLEYRMHLRNEFLRTGLDKMLQLEYFKSDKDEDYYELVHKFDNVFIDIQELDDCYDVIKNLVKNTPSENHFLSIMQHLMFIRDDMDIRHKEYLKSERRIYELSDSNIINLEDDLSDDSSSKNILGDDGDNMSGVEVFEAI
uniref:GBD/FH3 domain-containing protein n=1 Tax=Timema shepardi TaxID=629360 RepID=A0A7R9B3W7_TIMSH|nr:unnamed protein product [Timema shepardi]